MQQDPQKAIAALLSQTGSAHGVYEERELNGVYDQNWPDWYAAYLLQHGIGDLLNASITVESLSRLLKQYDQDYKRERPSVGWPDFYAQRLLAQTGK
jgi:hypothetical protein